MFCVISCYTRIADEDDDDKRTMKPIKLNKLCD